MKIRLTLIFITIVSFSLYSQMSSKGMIGAKEWSKEESLFKAKQFLVTNIFEISEKPIKFYVDPLAASSSGELTTLIYKCEDKNKEGLLLGFYGNYWNEAGVLYQGYSFKNFTKEEANDFLKKIEDVVKENKEFFSKDIDNNNVTFKYGDIQIILYTDYKTTKFRLFWNGFDSTWENTSFERTKMRFEKKIITAN